LPCRIRRNDHGNGAVARRADPSAQQINHGRKLHRPVDRAGRFGGSRTGVFDLIGRVDDGDEIMIEIALEPIADAALHPLRIVIVADGLGRAVGRGDAFKFAQDPRGAIADRLLDQFLFAIERNFVRPPRGA